MTSFLVLDIIFNLDQVITHYKTKPLDYISYLLKYSGSNSLISFLKKNKLASKIDVGIITSDKEFCLFAISLTLTDEGYNKVNEVIKLTFNYINLIKQEKVNEETYNEIYNITKTQFKFMDKKSTYGEYLSSLALNMFQYEDQEIMYGDYIHRYFNQTLIQEYVNNLAPENAIIMIGSIGLPPKNITLLLFDKAKNKTESWNGTKFIVQKLTKEYKKSLNVFNPNEHFQLRTKNIFITAESQIKTCLDENVKLKINFF